MNLKSMKVGGLFALLVFVMGLFIFYEINFCEHMIEVVGNCNEWGWNECM